MNESSRKLIYSSNSRIFVAVPKIVQQKLDEAELSIEGIRVTNPTSNSLTMSINSTIRADDSVHARIEGFTGVMYLEDLEGHEPFARIDFPETTTKKIQTVNVTQDMQIDNIDALATFNTWLVSNETLRVTVEGDTKVHVKGLSKAYGATFKKTIELNGLNNFSGLRVTSASISLTPDENGDNFKGFTNIPNRSIFTLEVVSTPTVDAFLVTMTISPTATIKMLTRRFFFFFYRAPPPSPRYLRARKSALRCSTTWCYTRVIPTTSPCTQTWISSPS